MERAAIPARELPARPRAANVAGLAVVVAAIALTWFAYGPAMNGGFIWDDQTYIAEGTLTRADDGLRRIWLTTESLDYFPIAYSLLWAEWHAFGEST